MGGFVIGLLMAVFVKAKVPALKKFAWEKDDYNEEEDEFLQHFDEDGNFIENKPPVVSPKDESIQITYHYKKESKKRTQSNLVTPFAA